MKPDPHAKSPTSPFLQRLGSWTFPRLLYGALALAGLATLPEAASAANVNLVTNGSFETGSFSGWTEIGDTNFDGVQCPGPALVSHGNCNAFFGAVGTVGGIQQSLATTAGLTYLISFAFEGDGTDPSSLQVDFGSEMLLSLMNPPAGLQTFSFLATATAANTVLAFRLRDDAGYLTLDNVQVSAVPEPASMALVSLALAGLGSIRRRKTH